MRTIRTTAAALLVGTCLLGASACAHTTHAAAPLAGTEPGMVTQAQGTARRLSAADDAFFRTAYSDASAGLTIGRMAQQKGTSAEVKRLGQKLVGDSSRQLADLQRLAAGRNLALPGALQRSEQDAVSGLSNASGADFDRAFLAHLRERDHAILSELRREEKAGADPGLKSYARSEVPVVSAQIDQARGVGAAEPQKGVTAPHKNK